MINKIILIGIISLILLIIETGIYIFLRKISKDRHYGGYHLDDAYITGIGIIVIIAIMLWQNVG